jgi:hypothetical protein
MVKEDGYTPKVVTKVRTGGDEFVGEDLRTGSRSSAISALERKLTCIAIVRRIRVAVLQAGEGLEIGGRLTSFPTLW